MSDPIEPLDPKLASLLRGEAAEPFVSTAARTRIEAALLAKLNLPDLGGGDGGGGGGGPDAGPAPAAPPAPAVPSGGSFLAAPLGSGIGAAVIGAVFAAGVATGLVSGGSSPMEPPPAMFVAAAPDAAAPDAADAPLDAGVAEDAGAAEDAGPLRPAPRTERVIRAPDAGVAATTLAQEQPLIDRARVALAKGYHQDALAALDEHLVRFPSGALVAERDGLRVLALARAGDRDAARKAAAKYLREHPRGILAEPVRKVLEETR